MLRNCGAVPLLVAALVVLACGGGAPETDRGSAMEPAGQEQEPRTETPAEMGEKVGDLYIEALREARELLADEPPAEEVRDDLAAMKERYVQELVALGKEREQLDESVQPEFDRAARMKIRSVDDELFAWYQEAVAHYRPSEFADQLASLNLLTQYAFFELLEEQEPEEAERLGIQ